MAHEPFAARDVVLADGGSARVRTARPDDAERLVAFHRGLSLETIHFRYFSALAKLPQRILDRFTRVNFDRDMVLVAELGDRIIALASYHGDGAPGVAEVAFVVADEHHGRGLATLMLEELAEVARERGVSRFRADTLSNNRDMLRVFADAGFELDRASDLGVVHLGFPVAETPRTKLARERREHLAQARSIAAIVAPRSVALAGEFAAEAPRLRAQGFRGELSADPERLRERVDLVLYAGPVGEVPGLVATAAQLEAHALLLGELRGEPAGLERDAFDFELRIAVRRQGMRLLGPASCGLANTAPGVSLCAGLGPPPAPGRVSIACDASRDAAELLAQLRAAGVGVAQFVSLGRRADVSLNDLLQHWAEDEATGAVALAVSKLGNAQKFARVAARVLERKPVLALTCEGLDAELASTGARTVDSVDAWLAALRELG